MQIIRIQNHTGVHLPPPDPTLWNQQVGATTVNVTEAERPNKTLAIVSLVCGLLGLLFIGIIVGAVGVVTGAIALKKIKENPNNYGGRGMAIGGLALSSIAFLINAIGLIYVLTSNGIGNVR